MKCKWILQGRVTTGAQTASCFTQLDWVQEQCSEKLGFKPFPGTLNIEIGIDYFPVIAELQDADVIELVPEESGGCAGRVIPVSIGNIRGAIISPEGGANIHGENIIEVIAPVGLRESLHLNDGHIVTLFADRPGRVPLDAVIFDLDGTLLDSVRIYYRIICTVLNKLGFPDVTMDVMREATEDTEFDWQMVLPESVDIKQPGLMETIHSAVEELYRPMFEFESMPIPGMKGAVEGLAAAGIKLAIVTSTPREHVDFKLSQLKQNGTLSYFDVIVTANDTPRQKPAPDPMIECCRQLGVELETSVYIGDSMSDIQSGRSAGMKTIAVLSGFGDLNSLISEHPDAVIGSVAELNSIIGY